MLISFLGFFIPGYSANWVKVAENSTHVAYINVDKVTTLSDNIISFWTLTNYKNNNVSAISKFMADCVKGKKTHLYFSYYNEPMGKGRVVSQDNWERSSFPKPNTIKSKVMKFACKYQSEIPQQNKMYREDEAFYEY